MNRKNTTKPYSFFINIIITFYTVKEKVHHKKVTGVLCVTRSCVCLYIWKCVYKMKINVFSLGAGRKLRMLVWVSLSLLHNVLYRHSYGTISSCLACSKQYFYYTITHMNVGCGGGCIICVLVIGHQRQFLMTT